MPWYCTRSTRNSFIDFSNFALSFLTRTSSAGRSDSSAYARYTWCDARSWRMWCVRTISCTEAFMKTIKIWKHEILCPHDPAVQYENMKLYQLLGHVSARQIPTGNMPTFLDGLSVAKNYISGGEPIIKITVCFLMIDSTHTLCVDDHNHCVCRSAKPHYTSHACISGCSVWKVTKLPAQSLMCTHRDPIPLFASRASYKEECGVRLSRRNFSH